MMDKFLEKLTQIKKDEDQYESYLSNNSTVVIAGPGSGKTTVLTLKIMRLLREKIGPPRGLACVTFNKLAVNEFKERLSELGYKARENVFLGTVHSFCIAEIITPFAHLYDYGIPMPLQIVSETEKKSLFKKIVSDLGLGESDLRIEDMDKERSLNTRGLSRVKIPSYDVALRLAKEYENRLHKKGMVDFLDIVKYATLLIQDQEYVRKCLEAKFPWILIDEYQDLGKPLHEMVLSLFGKTNIKIFAVGDPDQSIYGYNGAQPDYLLELHDYPNILPIKLKTNFRSNQDIINASEVALNSPEKREYKAGTRVNENADFHFIICDHGMEEQFQKVTDEIIPSCLQSGVPLEEIAIMVGTNNQAKQLRVFMDQASIPVYVAKFDFKRSDIVTWLEKCATWSLDITNQSFGRLTEFWIRLLKTHGKQVTVNDVVTVRKKLYDVLNRSADYSDSLHNWLTYVIEELNLIDLLKSSPIHPDEIENLNKLMEMSADGEFENYDVSKFSRLGKPENQVTITTRHSSKGLEYEVVILLGMEEGHFPFYKSVDDERLLSEEHRVFFVCISRSRRVCYLVRSEYYTYNTRYGPKTFNKDPSRFWDIIYSRYGETVNVK
jgi:DNA helicase-2/ATP-dependent DNA helicase PcrA